LRVVLSLLPFEVHRVVPACRRFGVLVLGAEPLQRRPGLDQGPVDREVLVGKKLCGTRLRKNLLEEFFRHLRGKQALLVLGESGRIPDVVFQRQADEPAKQDVVLDPLHQEADAADRVERLQQKRLQEFLRRDRRTPGVGVHRRKLGGKGGKGLFDHVADGRKGVILRNEGLRGAVTEHPVGLEIRSAHKSISFILKGFYAGFYHGNRIYVTQKRGSFSSSC